MVLSNVIGTRHFSRLQRTADAHAHGQAGCAHRNASSQTAHLRTHQARCHGTPRYSRAHTGCICDTRATAHHRPYPGTHSGTTQGGNGMEGGWDHFRRRILARRDHRGYARVVAQR